MKSSLLVLILSGIFLFSCSRASHPTEGENDSIRRDWLKPFASSFLEIQDHFESHQPALVRWLYQSPMFSFEAGLQNEPVSAECQFDQFRLIEAAHSRTIDDLTTAYLQKCEGAIQTGHRDFFRNLYRTLFLQLDVNNHPYLRRVVLHLPNGYRLPALVAMKDSRSRRPWVLLRAGIYGNSIDVQAERFMVMQMFEDGPFNVLMLDSLTSPETLRLNDKLTVGGLDEGLQNYQVAARMQSPQEPLSRLVSEVHLMAMSMGGHGLLMAMALNEVNPPVFRDALALCPLVQMEKTFADHAENPAWYAAVNLYSSLRMWPLAEKVPGIHRLSFMPEALTYVREHYRGPVTDDGTVRFPSGLDKTNFSTGNDVLPLLGQIHRPVAVFATEKDMLVPYKLNAAVLRDHAAGNPKIQVHTLREGFHCTLPGAYSWDQVSNLFRAQLMREWKQDLPPGFHRLYWPLPQLQMGQLISNQLRFHLAPGDENLTVDIQSAEGGSGRAADKGTPVATVQIPIQALTWQVEKRVRNQVEAATLIHFVRHNLHLSVNPQGHPALMWGVPSDFVWTGSGVQIESSAN